MKQVNSRFDTLTAARQLKAGGFDDNQVAALVKLMRVSGESAVTKSDLSAMDASLRREIATIRADLQTMAHELRGEISTTAAELRGEIAATAAELRGEIATTKAELRADMNAMANKMLLSQLAIAGLLFAAIKTFT